MNSEIVRMYQDGTGYTRIGKRLGIPRRQVRQILVGEGVEIRKPKTTRYQVEETAFDVIDNECAAYWLGFIYADGCVSKNDALRINISAKDKEHLEKIKPFMKTKRPLLPSRRMGRSQVLFKVVSLHLAKRLRRLGILVDRPKYCLAVSQVPQEMMRHFIRGYFDGDGSARKKRVTIRFCGQRDLLEWMKEHFRETLGADCNRKILAYKSTDKIYLLEFSPPDSRLVRDYMYESATVWLGRKRQIADAWE